jgi:hypothetical protein
MGPGMTALVDFAALDRLMSDRAVFDCACPWCGSDRREHRNRVRPVLRLWSAPGFISYHCARCGEHGSVREHERHPIDRDAERRARAVIDERERVEVAARRNKARGLWRMRRPITGTLAETYLRSARGITCRLPPTLAYLPPRGEHGPAMIAAFGVPDEPEPGVISIAEAAVAGVHLTKLTPDGRKLGTERDKIMVGRSVGTPIVLAPMNDLLGLAITEGIEDALSVHAATGLGAWAAGAASRLASLAAVVPDYTGAVSIFADADRDGQRHAHELRRRLVARGFPEITMIELTS